MLDQFQTILAKMDARAQTQRMDEIHRSLERLIQGQEARIARFDAMIARFDAMIARYDARRARPDRNKDA